MKHVMNKVMDKAKGVIQNVKKKAVMLSLAASTALAVGSARLTAFASEGGGGSTFDATTLMSGAVNDAKSQMFAMLGIVVPAIVAITVAVIGVKFAISWIKKIRGA